MNRREILLQRKKLRGKQVESGIHVETFELPEGPIRFYLKHVQQTSDAFTKVKGEDYK